MRKVATTTLASPRPINRVPEGFDLFHLAFEQEEDAVGGVAVEVEAAGEAAGDRPLDDRQFADRLVQPVGDFDRAELHRHAARSERLAAKRDRPRKRGFQAVEHGHFPSSAGARKNTGAFSFAPRHNAVPITKIIVPESDNFVLSK